MKIPALATIIVLGFALSGCATIVKGTSQSISISTPPVRGAKCVLSSEQGTWRVTSPGVVKVERSQDDLQVRCSKQGYEPAVGSIPSNFEVWTLGDVLLPGFLIWLGVDAATGAINKYPRSFQVPMDRDDGSPNTSTVPAWDDGSNAGS